MFHKNKSTEMPINILCGI